MPCKQSSFSTKYFSIYCILFFLLFSGCGQKRWDAPFPEEENRDLQKILLAMQQQEQQCFQNFDADMKMFWKSPLGDNAVEGYLILNAPSSVKYVVTNPLGQPIFAFTGNGKRFQMLKPLERQHIRGNVRSFAIRNRIPLILAQGDWFAYLSGRLPLRKLTVEESAKDSNNNSIWLKIATPKGPYTTGSVYLQIDPNKKVVLSYLFLDDSNDMIAEIRYGEQKEGDTSCGVHTEIQITGLPWGAAIRIELENISGFNQFTKADFSLPVPTSFNTQLWP
jgi:hypothetical protein